MAEGRREHFYVKVQECLGILVAEDHDHPGQAEEAGDPGQSYHGRYPAL